MAKLTDEIHISLDSEVRKFFDDLGRDIRQLISSIEKLGKQLNGLDRLAQRKGHKTKEEAQ